MTTALASLIPLIAGLASLASIGNGFLALRAKERLKREITHAVEADIELRANLRKIRDEISTEDLEVVQKQIEQLASSLSESDRRAIGRSLHQASKEGEKRYILDMLSAT